MEENTSQIDQRVQHFAPNWVNGQKLNARHFFEAYYHRQEDMQSVRAIGMSNLTYGIGVDGVSFDIISDSPDMVKIRLLHCDAITRSGLHILYAPSLYGDYIPEATAHVGSEDTDFYIVASVNPYKVVPIGIPDPEEIPLHHPYVLPEIHLYLLNKGDTNKHYLNTDYLVIGEVFKKDGKYHINREFIPPIQRVAFHKKISTFRANLLVRLKQIKEHIFTLYQKNRHGDHRAVLVDNTFILSEAYHAFFSHQIFFLENIVEEMPPVYLVESVSILANHIAMGLNKMVEKEREEVLQYYHEWTDISPSTFLQAVSSMTQIQYNHMDIEVSLETMEHFISILLRLFSKMSELEYIGLMRDNIIVSDNSTSKQRKQVDSWRIL